MNILKDFCNGVNLIFEIFEAVFWFSVLFVGVWFLAIFKGGRQKARRLAYKAVDDTSGDPEGKAITKKLIDIYLGYF